MTDAIDNDPAPTNLNEDLAAAWDEQDTATEEVVEEAQDTPEAEVEEETPTDTEIEAEAAEEESEEAVEEPEEPVEGLVAPEHWSSADREMFDALDDEAKEFVNRRYASMEKDYHSKTQKAASSIKFSETIKGMLDPFRERMNLAGIDEVAAIQKLVAAQDLLERDPKAGIEHLAKAYGVDLDEVDVEFDEVDPEIAKLKEEIRLMKTNQTTNSIEAQNAAIEQFKDATDGKGNALHPFFEDVYDDMVTLVKSRVATDLDGAYQKAVWANPDVRSKMMEALDKEKDQARKAEIAKKTAAAKRIAKTNLKGSGDAQAEAGKELSLQQELAKNYDKL